MTERELAPTFSELYVEALERLPDDYPDLARMKSHWTHVGRDNFSLTNPKYRDKCKKEIDDHINKLLKKHNQLP
jgi:hypothetical protein